MANKKKKRQSRTSLQEAERREQLQKEKKSRVRNTALTFAIGIVCTVTFMKWPISLDFETVAFAPEELAAVIDTSFAAQSQPVDDTVSFGSLPLPGGGTAAFCEVDSKLFMLGEVEEVADCSFTPVTISDESGYYIYTAPSGNTGDTQLIYIEDDKPPVCLFRAEGAAICADIDGDGRDETVIESGSVKLCSIYEWDMELGQAQYSSINAALKKEAVFYNSASNYFSPTFGGIGFLLDSYTYEDGRLMRHVHLDRG